jgi:cold shock protein
MRPYQAKELARHLPAFDKPPELRGEIKWYHSLKGFGFITPEIGPDVFLHESALLDPDNPPNKGDRVLYSAGRRRNGKFGALSVKVLE